jgi:hypothetical protein
VTPKLTTTGITALKKRIATMSEEIPKAMERIVKMEATTLCSEYARATGPGKTLSEKPILNYQRKVEGQIRQLFPASDRPYAIAAIIGRRSKPLAAAYLRAIKQNKPAQARRYLRDAGIQVETISQDAHKAARTGTGGSVPKDHEPIAVVNSAKLRAYIKTSQAKVGMAKASWLQAALGIVKRLRTQQTLPDGSRRSFEKFPPTIKRVARRFPGLGGSTITGSGFQTTVTIFSNVSHGPDALDIQNYALANAASSKTLASSIAHTIAYLNRKLFR